MYEFLIGPALWITFIVFLGGMAVRLVLLFRLSRKKDPVFYNHMSFKWGFKSIFFWLLPLGTVSLRRQPVFSISVFFFHLSLIAVPLFFCAHNIMWDEAFGVSLWSLPDGLVDIMSVVLICTSIFLFVRRLFRPEVRVLTELADYMFLILCLLPFLTGFLAYHQWGPYDFIINMHIVTAELLLILIPFTKLGHMVLFFITRAFIGFEMGTRRGARTW